MVKEASLKLDASKVLYINKSCSQLAALIFLDLALLDRVGTSVSFKILFFQIKSYHEYLDFYQPYWLLYLSFICIDPFHIPVTLTREVTSGFLP